MTPVIRCATYKRVSTEDQKEDNQQPILLEYVKKRGWEIVSEYVDHGVSAYKDDVRRPDFENMIKAAKTGCFDVILVVDLDRFSRRPAWEVVDLIKELHYGYDVQVYTARDWNVHLSKAVNLLINTSRDDYLGRLMAEFISDLSLGVQASMAHEESEKRSHQIKRGLANSMNPSGRPRISNIKTEKLVTLREGGCKENDYKPMSDRQISKHLEDVHKKKMGHVTVGNRIKEYYKNKAGVQDDN